MEVAKGNQKVRKADEEVRQEMLDKTKGKASFDVRDASGVSMTPEEIEKEITRCKKTKKNYELMNYMMAFYSGMLFITYYSNFNHVMNDLHKSNSEYSQFYNLTATSWTFKPVFGWISDSFYPFRYRFKSYIILMNCIHGFFCILCFLNPNNYITFAICVFFIYFAVGFVDTLAEGMTAMITKMEARIQELTPPEERKAKEAESKAIGFFFMFRLFVRTLAMFLGGSLANAGVDIKIIYLILLVCPGLMLLYTLLIFKEARKTKVWNGCSKICKALGLFFKVLINPALFLPLLYNVMLIAIPNLGDLANYMLIRKGGWNIEQISYVTLSTGVLFSFFMIWFLKTWMPKITFYSSYVIGGAGVLSTNLMLFLFLDPESLGFGKMFAIYWVQTMIGNFTGNLPQIATIGRFTTYMPEGFESTGVTLLVAFSNMGVLSSGLLAASENSKFNVVDGYYERAKKPMLINCWISLGVCALCPLFVAWKVKGLKKSHGEVENIEEKPQASNYKSMKDTAYEAEQLNSESR